MSENSSSTLPITSRRYSAPPDAPPAQPHGLTPVCSLGLLMMMRALKRRRGPSLWLLRLLLLRLLLVLMLLVRASPGSPSS